MLLYINQMKKLPQKSFPSVVRRLFFFLLWNNKRFVELCLWLSLFVTAFKLNALTFYLCQSSKNVSEGCSPPRWLTSHVDDWSAQEWETAIFSACQSIAQRGDGLSKHLNASIHSTISLQTNTQRILRLWCSMKTFLPVATIQSLYFVTPV